MQRLTYRSTQRRFLGSLRDGISKTNTGACLTLNEKKLQLNSECKYSAVTLYVILENPSRKEMQDDHCIHVAVEACRGRDIAKLKPRLT